PIIRTVEKSVRVFQRLRLVLLVIAVLLTHGCIEIATNVDFPGQEPKVVVHAFISPADSAAMVLLTWSIPVQTPHGETQLKYIENAVVRISAGDGREAYLDYDSERKLYTVSAHVFPIASNEEYYLMANVPGQSVITAACYIPPANNTLHLIELDTLMEDHSKRLVVSYGFTDIPRERENFYAPAAYREVSGYYWQGDSLVYKKVKHLMHHITGGLYFSNTGNEGKDFVIRAESYLASWDKKTILTKAEDEPGSIILLLLVTDEHYFRYHRDLLYYEPDDFFSEAAHIYSNIEGGLGVFAGFNRTEVTVEFE
ncbi:MAG: DUF4249 domain-containing protein, partial [Bacteroidia bacterium]